MYRLLRVLLSDMLRFQAVEAHRRELLCALLRARRHHHDAYQDSAHARHSCTSSRLARIVSFSFYAVAHVVITGGRL